MNVSALLNRLSLLRSQGGWRAVASRIGRRLLYRRWVSLVYCAESPLDATDRWPDGFRFGWFERLSDLQGVERQQLEEAGGHRMLADLGPADAVYVVWQGERAASWGAVPRVNRQVALLGLAKRSRLIGLCETHPAFRGQGLYPLALRETVRRLRLAGETALYIEVLEDNRASIRGIERAGFRRLGRIDARVVLGKLVLRNGRLGWI